MIDPLPLPVGERFLNPLRMKHHLRSGNQKKKTRLIVPLQTPLDRRGMLAWTLYIVRTSTIAKNRHLNIVLRAELYLRTGTYDRPNLAKALAIDAYPRIALRS